MARELQTTAAVTLDTLHRLSASIVTTRRGAEPEYRFTAADEEHGKAVDALGELYRQDRFQLLRLIAPAASVAIQDFADAFELKKKEEDE